MTGNVLLFDDTHPHVRVIDIDVQPAYPDCKVYRRRLVHVHVDEGRSRTPVRDYLVDYFDVEGGATHDYFLHGCADEEGVLETSIALDRAVASLVPEWGGTKPHTGEDCLDTSGETRHAYVFLRNVQAAEAGQPCTATWRYGEAGLRSHLFPEPGSVLHRFQAPSIRKARQDDAKLDAYMLNGIMQRHTGGVSRFRAVHVPFKGAPWVDEATCEDDTFTVVYGDVTDTVRCTEDRVTVASSAGWEYDSGAAVSGTILSVERDGTSRFLTDGPAPDAHLVRVDFGGKRRMMFRVASTEDKALVLAEDPGFAYDASADAARFLYHPHETLPGPLTWTAWQ